MIQNKTTVSLHNITKNIFLLHPCNKATLLNNQKTKIIQTPIESITGQI